MLDAGVTITGHYNGMSVDLSVLCGRETADLNWSSGGVSVQSIRLAQQCNPVNESETSEVLFTDMIMYTIVKTRMRI